MAVDDLGLLGVVLHDGGVEALHVPLPAQPVPLDDGQIEGSDAVYGRARGRDVDAAALALPERVPDLGGTQWVSPASGGGSAGRDGARFEGPGFYHLDVDGPRGRFELQGRATESSSDGEEGRQEHRNREDVGADDGTDLSGQQGPVSVWIGRARESRLRRSGC